MRRWYLTAIVFVCLWSKKAEAETKLQFYTEVAAPYYFLDEHGQAQGISVDIVNALVTCTSVSGEIVHLPWARAVRETHNNPNIVLTSVLRTPEREQQFQWLGTIDTARASLIGLHHQREAPLDSIDQAKDSIVATIRGYGSASYLAEQGFVEGQNLVLVSQPEQLWALLFKGRVDYVTSNALTGKYEVSSLDLDPNQLRTVLDIDELALPLEMATGLTTDSDTVALLTKALKQLKQTGEYHRILKKWSSPSAQRASH